MVVLYDGIDISSYNQTMGGYRIRVCLNREDPGCDLFNRIDIKRCVNTKTTLHCLLKEHLSRNFNPNTAIAGGCDEWTSSKTHRTDIGVAV